MWGQLCWWVGLENIIVSIQRWRHHTLISNLGYIKHVLPVLSKIFEILLKISTTTTQQLFYGPFLGPPGWAGARRELLDFMVQGKINRFRHTDHPAMHHSIRTNQCPMPISIIPTFLQVALPATQPMVSKHWRYVMSCYHINLRDKL